MKNTKLTLLFIVQVFLISKVVAQSSFVTENDKFKAWQPDVKIEFSDFQAKEDTNFLKLCNKYNYHTISNVQIFAYLDIPKSKNQRKKKLEQVYIAPAFCKKCSFARKYDSLEIKQQEVYFMIAEYATRIGRMEFDSLRIKIPNTTGIYNIMFMTIKNDMIERMRDMFAGYSKDILVDKRLDAYEEWATFLKNRLEELQKYATKPIDCHRIITEKPVLEDYILAPIVIDDQRKKK